MHAIFLILCCTATVTFGQDNFTETFLSFDGPVAYDDEKYEETIGPNPQERAEMLGYTAETHNVTTEDGYILTMYRITGSKVSPPAPGKPPVFLFHGMSDCSATWVLAHSQKALGFILADRGYDVWMGNARGTRYSRYHKWLTTKDRAYWMFSWHEIGMCDLPAMIDFILRITGKKQIIYIGHSQGCTTFFVLASMRPEYQLKIKVMIALAPAAYMYRSTSPVIRTLALVSSELKIMASMCGVYEFMPTDKTIQTMANETCGDNALTQPLCEAGFFLLSPGETCMNQSLPYLQYIPAGLSVMQLAHFGQSVNTARFAQYDFGLLENMERYNSVLPPSYDLAAIQTEIHIMYSMNDVVVHPLDVLQTASELPNCETYLVPEPTFTHTDFVWCTKVDVLVYDKVTEILEKHRAAIS